MKSRIFFIDAAAVLLCSAALALSAFSGNSVLLLLILVMGTAVLLAASGKALYSAELFFCAPVLLFPQAVLFIPSVLYSAAVNRHKIPAALGALTMTAAFFRYGADFGTVCAAALAVIAAVLGLRSGELARRSSELIRTRDNDAELEIKLRQKNRELLKKQDDEVNIATLRERNRIAREIHDNVGHLLSRALLQSGALLAVTDKEKMPVQYTQVSALKETLGSAMNSIRESVHGLRDDSVDLHRAVNEAAEAVSGRFRVTAELDFSEKMPAAVKLCFIAVVKEALSNAVKHSSGNSIKVIIREHPAFYQLSVIDNGRPSGISGGGGMGLDNMRERAEALGGIFGVDTSDGFRIFISVKRDTEEKEK